MDAQIFERHEAQVRSYCRSFPTIFKSGKNATLHDTDDNQYIDFLAGAGALNYGHNNPEIKRAVVDYLSEDGIIHALDMYTEAKADFIQTFQDVVLRPRGLDYKLTFPGPTGTNAVETALKYARRATGRHNVIAFTNAFHGMTLGSLALSATGSKREGAGAELHGVTRMPYDGYHDAVDTAQMLDKMLSDQGGGIDAPAAIIVETIQAEGGLNMASARWLRSMSRIAEKHGAIFIIDDIQAGCGRTGTFFSFEDMGFTPDMVCLSKSIGGMGLPMSLLLFREDLDVLKPGEHNGTFRGHNLAFVAARAALEFWRNGTFEHDVKARGDLIAHRLERIVQKYPAYGAHVRGRGLMLGIAWHDDAMAQNVSEAAFVEGVIVETTGANGDVLKLLPPLTITDVELSKGLDALERAVEAVTMRDVMTNCSIAAE